MDLDLKDMFHSPTNPIKKSKKRMTLTRVALGSTREPLKKIKKTVNKKRTSIQLTIEPKKSPDNSTSPAAVSTGEQTLRSVHQVKFSRSQPEIALLEPSCPCMFMLAQKARRYDRCMLPTTGTITRPLSKAIGI
uniref:Uncharacterized protein n=1 Tax=Cannabis sativa TaxID=3483 RepID=A0A803NJL8_CANSA